ncbi:MAG TPA: hypothetical protein VJZ26_03935, partial [Blastocatellia bacterium]|nr:hypothetical protein [Blastocatellia bacterium]
ALFRRERIPVGFIYPPSAHSITFVPNAFSTDDAGPRRRDGFSWILAASGLVHAGFIVLLLYLAIANLFAPYTNVRMVKRPYRPFDSALVAQLYASQRKLESSPTDKVMSLEEMREREQKRREEIERRKREKAAREKAEEEKREKQAQAQAQAKAGAPDKPAEAEANAEPSKYGEINETALKDLVGKIYSMYKAGGIELKDFSVMASFKIARDGSLPRSSIVLVEKSGDAKKDDFALQILWLIGESHALGPLWQLSSNSVRFDLKDDVARLTIAGFGPTPDWVNQKASELRMLFWLMSKAQKNSNAAELLSLVKIRTTDNRIALDLTVSRERASEMMRAQYAGNANN